MKPSGASGSSPISPQIKVPPPPQQPGLSGQPPPNLPTREEKTFPSNPLSPTPPQPNAAQSLQPELKADSSVPPISSPGASSSKVLPASSPPPQPVSPSSAPPVFKSSIRTMEEDIAAIKKGQPPVGIQIEKQSEKDVKPQAPITAPGPKITPPPKPAAEVRLGEAEKAKPLPSAAPLGEAPLPSKPIFPPAPPTETTGLTVPPTGGFSKKRLIFVAGGLVLIVFLVWFFALRAPSAPEVALSPTPTRTATPAPTPIPIENYFSILDSASIPLGPGFTDRFNSSVNATAALKATVSEPALYAVFNPASGQKYTLSEFLGGLLISPPAGLISAVYDNSLYLTAIYKSDGKNGFGFITRTKEPSAAMAALRNWEQTISQDIKDLLGFNPAKAASTAFLDNTYQDVAIRYRNFPDPNLTIDYAIVRAKNGENYLVVTNSKEHMYAIIDKLR